MLDKSILQLSLAHPLSAPGYLSDTRQDWRFFVQLKAGSEKEFYEP